jgi:hypothetical protein
LWDLPQWWQIPLPARPVFACADVCVFFISKYHYYLHDCNPTIWGSCHGLENPAKGFLGLGKSGNRKVSISVVCDEGHVEMGDLPDEEL